MEAIDALIQSLRTASDDDERESIKAQLMDFCRGTQGAEARSHLESAARGEVLEVQWTLEEVVEATSPRKAPPDPPVAEEEKLEPEPDPNRELTADDLVKVYDQPGALILHRTKDSKRWFATQVDPRSGQPQTFELQPNEVDQVKSQLAGSPYWVLGPPGTP